jgi:hypothetical protein
MLRPLLFVAAPLLAAVAVQAAPAPTAPKSTCAPPPAVDAIALTRHKQAAAGTLRNFDTAYRKACSKGLLRNRPLIAPGSVPPNRLFLKNAPEANIASFYNEGEGRPGRMVLEYPFLTADGQIHFPTADELEEAIFCAVVGVTSEEDEGRCLPD